MIETNSKSKSQFVGYFGVKNYAKIERDLIRPLADRFFAARNIKTFKPIDESAAFSDLDFDRKNFDDFFGHFYEFIVDGIHKNGDNVEIPVTYCITLDKQNCEKFCEQTQIHYDEILLFDTPVFYFIYVDVKEVFSCLRGENVAVVELPEIEVIEEVEPKVELIETKIIEPEPIEIPKPESKPNEKRIGKFIVDDGIATDTETGLTWLRFAHGQRWGNSSAYGNCKSVTSDEVKNVIKQFNSIGYMRYKDWRIPTIDELKTLIDTIKGEVGNYIDADVFPRNGESFWSSSSYFSSGDRYVWSIYFNSGNSYDVNCGNYQNKKKCVSNVRLVRGGQ